MATTLTQYANFIDVRSSTSGRRLSTTIMPWLSLSARKRWNRSARNVRAVA